MTGKDVLFIDDEDYRTMMGLMKEISAKYEVSVFAFCLLPNHIHLLVRPAKDNLHLFVRDLCGRYATRFNKRYERRGHLFRTFTGSDQAKSRKRKKKA